jgi:hypothetical protein
MANEGQERWFTELVDAGLHEEIFNSSDFMAHATPEVLAANLPAELMAKVLEAALSRGALTTDGVLETLTPDVVSHHLPHDVIWACITTSASRSGIAESEGDVQYEDKRRTFLCRIVSSGLETQMMTAEDVIKHVTAELLAKHLPVELKAKLIAEGLRADALNPSLIVDVVGVEALAGHIPMKFVWSCVAEVGERVLANGASEPASADDTAKDKKKVAGAAAAVARPAAAGGNGRRAKSKGKTGRGVTGLGPRARLDTDTSSKSAFDDDTNVSDWADPDDFEVLEEADVGAVPDQVLGSSAPWTPDDESTDTVGIDGPGRK